MNLFLQLSSLAILSATIFSPSAQAFELGNMMRERVETHLDATMVQLSLPGECQVLQSQKKFQEEVLERVGASRNASLQALEDAGLSIGLGGPISTYFSAVYVYGGATSAGFILNPLKYFRMVSLFNIAAGPSIKSLMVGAGSVASAQSMKAAAGGDVAIMLNSDKLNALAKQLASETAFVFSLGRDAEASLVAATKAEMNKRFRDKDESPMDFAKVLKEAKFGGQPILSAEKVAVLDKLQSSDGKKSVEKSATTAEKVAALAISSSALEICANSGKMGRGAQREAMNRVRGNKALLKEVTEFAKAQAKQAPGQSAADEPASSLDAE